MHSAPSPTYWCKYFAIHRKNICLNAIVFLTERMASSVNNSVKVQNYDYFLVLDFEATCDEERKTHPIEIIEFPVLKINARTFQCESTFHTCSYNV